MSQNLLLVDGKVPVEDVQHLALHTADVPRLEDARAPRPHDVLHHLVVKVLAKREHVRSVR